MPGRETPLTTKDRKWRTDEARDMRTMAGPASQTATEYAETILRYEVTLRFAEQERDGLRLTLTAHTDTLMEVRAERDRLREALDKFVLCVDTDVGDQRANLMALRLLVEKYRHLASTKEGDSDDG